MIYTVLQYLSRVAVWLNFRKVYLEHRERVPAGKNVLYGQNHPTAFLDPIILASHLREQCWIMLRGDKFVNAPVRWFLARIHNLPIFREGLGDRAAMRSNLETMAHAVDRLLAGEPTIILSEGVCRHERRLRPIQRGTARMLMQAWRKRPDANPAIVPTAINYTDPNAFRSGVTITFGEPIYAADYAEGFRADARQAVDDISDELYRRLRGLVIHVEDPARDELAEALLPLVQHGAPDGGLWPTGDRSPYTRAQWRAVEHLNGLSDFEATALRRDLEAYRERLRRHGLTDSGVALPGYATWGRALVLWLTGPLVLLGWLLLFPAAAVAHDRTTRLVSNPQFFGSVRWGVGLVGFLVTVLVYTVAAAFVVGWWAPLVVGPAIYALGYGFLVHRDAFLLWRQAARTRSVPPATLAALRAERAGLLAGVGLLGEELAAVDPERA